MIVFRILENSPNRTRKKGQFTPPRKIFGFLAGIFFFFFGDDIAGIPPADRQVADLPMNLPLYLPTSTRNTAQLSTRNSTTYLPTSTYLHLPPKKIDVFLPPSLSPSLSLSLRLSVSRYAPCKLRVEKKERKRCEPRFFR